MIITTIREAIQRHNIIRFDHGGRSHIGEPHAYGIGAQGEECVEIYLFRGVYGRWALLPVEDLSRVKALERLRFEPREEEVLRKQSLVETYCHV